VDDGEEDWDGDGASNEEEQEKETDPTNPDTDGDGFNDHVDPFPTDPDWDGDGVLDGWDNDPWSPWWDDGDDETDQAWFDALPGRYKTKVAPVGDRELEDEASGEDAAYEELGSSRAEADRDARPVDGREPAEPTR
jgi:hypothetical protein